MELTPTARAVLGFLSFLPRSGYEVRRAARRSAGLVWGVNDGQLYPQLRHLHDLGLIVPDGEAEGSRSRQRWRITDAGRDALRDWIHEPTATATLRDEGLVKLLFIDQFGLGAGRDLLRQRREQLVDLERMLRGVVPGVERGGPDEETGLVGPRLVHRFGLDYVAMSIAWCDDALAVVEGTEEEQ